MENIKHNLSVIQQKIVACCEKNNRPVESVKLLLATKTVTPENISIAIQAGFPLIAENKVQELKDKFEALKPFQPLNHFIGHLQTNKIKDVLKCNVSCIESVDRLDLAEKLQQRLVFEDKHMDIFVQVNTSDEESKFGVHPNQAIELIKAISELDRLHIKGLMTIGLFSNDEVKVRACYRLLKSLFEEVKSLSIPRVEMNELSMGMSNDFEIAIEEGATIVRVGTAVFGQRIYPDSYYWNENKTE